MALLAMLLPVLPAVIHAQPAGADQAAAKAAQLEQVRSRISGVKEELGALRNKRDSTRMRLEKKEKEIGRITIELHHLDRDISRSQEKLQELESRKQLRLSGLQHLRLALAHDMRTAYAMGKQEQVKLLLAQQDPVTVGRMLSYQRYFTNARTERLHEIQSLLKELATLETQVSGEQAALEVLRTRQRDSIRRYEQEQEQRKNVLTSLHAGMEKKTDELADLERDAQHLQELINSLQPALRDIPPAAGEYPSLQEEKGGLSWPVAGRIRTAYGVRPGKGKPKSRGIFVDAPAGTEVHAIHRGRVAFADWLRGFGLLLIIDHGGGYMSLYGHNRALFRKPGDWVETGETIAFVGNSGGEQRTGLYLELRKNGRPFDPTPWFAGKPSTRRAAR